MKNLPLHAPPARATLLALALLLSPGLAAAQEAPANRSGWVANFTAVLILPDGDDPLGGGADPELRYCHDLGEVRLSAGVRVGLYHAKDEFSVTAMPTFRLTVPIGRVEPYVAAGVGYGWLTERGYANLATMARAGFVYRFGGGFSAGLEATYQRLEGSEVRFWSFGSAMAFAF